KWQRITGPGGIKRFHCTDKHVRQCLNATEPLKRGDQQRTKAPVEQLIGRTATEPIESLFSLLPTPTPHIAPMAVAAGGFTPPGIIPSLGSKQFDRALLAAPGADTDARWCAYDHAELYGRM